MTFRDVAILLLSLSLHLFPSIAWATEVDIVPSDRNGVGIHWSGATAGDVLVTLGHASGISIDAGAAVTGMPIPDGQWYGDNAADILAALLRHADYATFVRGSERVIAVTRLHDWPTTLDQTSTETAWQPPPSDVKIDPSDTARQMSLSVQGMDRFLRVSGGGAQ